MNQRDALRLAVKLKFDVCLGYDITKVTVIYSAGEFELKSLDEPVDPNPYAATRRAITLAAAEVGRSMK